jgi:hypothetical protein
MQLPNNAVSRNRAAKTARLIVSLFFATAMSAVAFGQVPPTLTLNSNVSLFFFGRVNTGALSPNTVITISNGGTGSVTVTNVQITGTNAADYTLVSTTCINATLTPTGTCLATVRFNPLAIGSRTANLTVTDTANGSQHLVPLRGTGLNPNIPNKAVGPIDPRIGFPLWYQDELGVKLTACLDGSGFCVLTPNYNTGAAASVTTAGINFPDEAFYWYADARITRSSGGNVRLVLAKEGAFTTPSAVVGQQIAFDRIRVRIDQLTPGATYTITHPFGVMTAVADANGGIVINSSLKTTATASTASAAPASTQPTATTADGFTPAPATTTTSTATPTADAAAPTDTAAAPTDTAAAPTDTAAAPAPAAKGSGSGGGGSTAEINTTEDIGCGNVPCDFRASLEGKVSRFLKWDPAFGPAAPTGYLGNPNVTHQITGSPFNTNIFKVDGPNVGGAGINSIQTNLFTLAGKLFQ